MLAEEYLEYVKKYTAIYGPNTAVFMLSGMFYNLFEMKNSDAYNPYAIITEILGIAHIYEDYGRRAGVPEHAASKYINELTKENWTVVLLSQEKDTKGRVKKDRAPLRIVSPGTNVDLLTRDAALLGGLWLEEPTPGSRQGPAFAATALDMSTGELAMYEGQGTGSADAWCLDDLHHFFQAYPPRELVVWWRGDALAQPTEGKVRHLLGLPTAMIQMRLGGSSHQGNFESAVARADFLQATFQPKTLLPLYEALGIAAGSRTERAVVSTLRYAKDHCPQAIQSMPLPERWTPADSVFLGNHALTQLGMIGHRVEDTVLGLFLQTETAMGRRAIRHRLLHPVSAREKLESAYEEIAWIQGLEPDARASLQSWLRQISDLPRLHRRILMAEISPREVLDLDSSYGCIEALLKEIDFPSLGLNTAFQNSFANYRAAFSEMFSVEKARQAGKTPSDLFCLTEAAGPKVATTEEKIQELQAAIEAEVVAFSRAVGQDRGAFRLEFKEASVSLTTTKAVFTDIQARMPSKAATSPAVKAMTLSAKKSGHSLESSVISGHFKTILALREQLVELIQEELPAACDRLSGPYVALWDALEKWVSHLDLRYTVARVSAERGFCRPTLLEDCGAASVEIVGLRHPLIETQTTRIEYVKHDVVLSDTACPGWLVYGMNASGKSSLMKAIGIATILAQCGCYVPATTFAFVPFRGIYTRILNTDDLRAGLSSFAVEMTELREILARADAYSLVLGDEVCSGTETTSATALVAAVLEEFEEKNVRFVFATHFHALQGIESVAKSKRLQTWHLKVIPTADRLVYSRVLEPGPGRSTYGLEVARAMQIPASVLERAFRIRRGLLGTVAEEDAPSSSWNSVVTRRACERCGCEIVRDLEVHHIHHRADGGGNDLRNLIVVCEKCHDAHHAGRLRIGPVQATSEGPQRVIEEIESPASAAAESLSPETTSLSQFAYQPSVAASATSDAEERKAKIESYLRKYPNCPLKRLVFDLRREEGIVLTEQKLRAIRSSLS